MDVVGGGRDSVRMCIDATNFSNLGKPDGLHTPPPFASQSTCTHFASLIEPLCDAQVDFLITLASPTASSNVFFATITPDCHAWPSSHSRTLLRWMSSATIMAMLMCRARPCHVFAVLGVAQSCCIESRSKQKLPVNRNAATHVEGEWNLL
jgi:hypothetical protein